MPSVKERTPLALSIKELNVQELKIGDVIYLNGIVYTARDMAHLRIAELAKKGETLPFDLRGSVLYHAGPVAVQREGKWTITSIGPTTSVRMEPYSGLLGPLGVKAIAGKGGMQSKTLNFLKEYGIVYLAVPHGCGVLGAETISKVLDVYWLDLGIPEAIWKFEVKNWGPLVVGMDSHGKDLYRRVKERARENLEKVLSERHGERS